MKYLKSFKIFEGVQSKSELIDTLKYYSNYLYTYIKDSNKLKGSGINLDFSYDTFLNMKEIFKFVDELEYSSSDGDITFICNEYVNWSNYFLEGRWSYRYEREFVFDYDYLNYTDDYKKENRFKLYDQDFNQLSYIYVGQQVKKMITGTIWEMPDKIKFNETDRDFILDALQADFEDLDTEYMSRASKLINIKYKSNSVIIKIPSFENTWMKTKLTKNTDFIKRLESYFDYVLLLPYNYEGYHEILLPFYN
jgi:hypothetical protein